MNDRVLSVNGASLENADYDSAVRMMKECQQLNMVTFLALEISMICLNLSKMRFCASHFFSLFYSQEKSSRRLTVMSFFLRVRKFDMLKGNVGPFWGTFYTDARISLSTNAGNSWGDEIFLSGFLKSYSNTIKKFTSRL